MTGFTAIGIGVIVISLLAYHRSALWIWTATLAATLIFITSQANFIAGLLFFWALFLAVFIPLNLKPIRKRFLSLPALMIFKKVMPSMSDTEREAISAGTVSWEGDLFRGNPNWNKLLSLPKAELTTEEQAFINGPVEELCEKISDWDITHHKHDLSPQTWKFLKDKGFFGLVIPKRYGGKGFSAYAHSQILVKISGKSITASTTVAVPNSLGPAELLLEYGTDEQKDYYLPRLARGEEVPCFALTSKDAGSDAGSMTDYGTVCWGKYKGKKTLGIRLTWDKRYITLAPVATVIGLAFKLYDPDNLLGKKEDIGITCALIPSDTPGVKIGRRHFPLDTPFQNGPTQGENVFIPVDWIIGGVEQAGNGWRMLMESLAGGRAITLPSSAVGGAKVIAYSTGAYSRIRKQFNTSISNFEGVEEPLARIGAYTYIMDAARSFATAIINQGEKPAVASAIVKYHVTEMGRIITRDAMDIHGGKGICLGPNNYLGRGYESIPISITVEGANILTRNLIIFGQGAIRCHPYIYNEIQAAQIGNKHESLSKFDKELMGHIGFTISNVFRSFILAICSSLVVIAPKGKTKRYFQHATRLSSAFALISDISMMTMGGKLKRKENISARLGDILSYLYLLSAVLKQYNDQGKNPEDLPIVHFSSQYCLYKIQQRINEVLRNYPSKLVATFLRIAIFPIGMHFSKPKDKFNGKVAKLFTSPTASRQRLSVGAYITDDGHNPMADIQDALIKSIEAEPVEKIVREAVKKGKVFGKTPAEELEDALNQNIINNEQYELCLDANAARRVVINVDDFANNELASGKTTKVTKKQHAK